MGLGPIVCTKCERIVDYIEDEEYEAMIADGTLRVGSYHFWCSKCGGQMWSDRESYYTQRDPQLKLSLWQLSGKDQVKYLRNSGIDEDHIKKYYSEYLED